MMLLQFRTTKEPVTIKMVEDRPFTMKKMASSDVSTTEEDGSGSEDGSQSQQQKTVRFNDVPHYYSTSSSFEDLHDLWYSSLELHQMALETVVDQRDTSLSTSRTWTRSYGQVLSTIYNSLKTNGDDVCSFPRSDYELLIKFLSADNDHHVLTGIERKVDERLDGELFRQRESTRQAVLIIQDETSGHPEKIRQASLRFSRSGQRLATTIGHAHHATLGSPKRRGLFGVVL